MASLDCIIKLELFCFYMFHASYSSRASSALEYAFVFSRLNFLAKMSFLYL